MNRELGYIWQGFFLMLVVLAGAVFVKLLASIKQEPVEQAQLIDYDNPPARPGDILYSASSQGSQLFTQNCAACHRVDKDLTGPALRGITDRIKDRQLLRAWIRNSAAVLKSGNPYFNDLYNKWNKTPMTMFASLTDAEIDAILLHVTHYKTPVYANTIAVCR